MDGIDVHANIRYNKIDTTNYQWIRFTVPVYGGKYPRGATNWEQECLDITNAFLDELFSFSGFKNFFVEHHCCVKKEEIVAFLQSRGSSISFPVSQEYRQPFTWNWCQLEGGQSSPGHIMDANGWFYDKSVTPSITVVIDGKEFKPFDDWESCFPSCAEDNNFAWKMCAASAYNVPYLYSLVRSCDFNMEYLFEGGFSADMDSGLYAVLEFFDEEVLPTYNVIVDEDNVRTKSGIYPMHIVDTSNEYLRALIRKNKVKIREILQRNI